MIRRRGLIHKLGTGGLRRLSLAIGAHLSRWVFFDEKAGRLKYIRRRGVRVALLGANSPAFAIIVGFLRPAVRDSGTRPTIVCDFTCSPVGRVPSETKLNEKPDLYIV